LASTLLVKWWVELGFCGFAHTDEVVHILINNSSADIVLKLKIFGDRVFLRVHLASKIVVLSIG
jgi:hypothetical protein